MKKLKPSNTEFLTYCKEVARQLIAGRSFRGKAGRPPIQPQAEVDARRLDGSYHEIAVTDSRKHYLRWKGFVPTQRQKLLGEVA